MNRKSSYNKNDEISFEIEWKEFINTINSIPDVEQADFIYID